MNTVLRGSLDCFAEVRNDGAWSRFPDLLASFL